MSFEKIIDVPRLNRFKTKILNLVYKKDEVYNKNEIDNKFSQNAFSKVTVGSTTVAADSKADTLTLVAGSNVTITPDATNDKITIAATDTKYSSKAAVSGGTDVSLVTTGEKATWNAKTSNTGTITQVKANGTNVATSGVANIPAASTSAYGVTKLTSDLTGTSESLAATQKAVNELNSNLSQLSYSDVAAGKNLFKGDFIKKVLDTDINYTDIDLSKEQNPIKNIEGITFVAFGAYLKKGTYTFSYTNNAYFSLNRIAIAGTNCIGVTQSIRKSYTWTQNVDGWTYFGIEGDDSETGSVDTPFSITPDIMIEKGSTATPYEPYIPSVKMLSQDVEELKNDLDKKAPSTHTHTKSQITDFPTSLPASDVYSWAKASSKPTYNGTELKVGGSGTYKDSTVESAISTLNSNFEWKYLGSILGSSKTIELPSSYSELLIEVIPDVSLEDSNMQRYTHHIIKEMLISSYRNFLCGHVYPPYTLNQGSAGIKVSLTMLMTEWSSRGTIDTSNSLNVLVWYR